MKKYKSILFVLFLNLGCQSEIEQNDNNNAKPMSFYAGVEIPKDSGMTKTVLDGTPSDAFRNVLWEYHDEVYVTNGLQSSKFINTTQGTSEIALLEGQLAEGANYFAAYPFNIVTTSSASSFSIDLPSEQTYCAGGIDAESFPMIAQCKEGVFNFKNICGILVVQLLGEQTITSVSFSGQDSDYNSIPVAGKGTVAVGYSDVPTLVMDNLSDTSVSLLSSTGVELSTTTPTSFHIVIPTGIYNTFELTIAAKDGSMMVVNSLKPLVIKRSQRTTAAALTYLDVIDLSSAGTANCYIVSEPGKYKFNASVKGNSVESIGESVSAEVLWESFGTDVIPSVGDIIRNVTYKDGYIEFDTPSVLAEGNAVIAAKDDSGTILWSWHIWLTDKPNVVAFGYDEVLDRNLGATSTNPGDVGALGLLYQWGRKDPFLGSSLISESIEAKSTGSWPVAISSSSNSGTIEFATEHPMTFILSNDDWYYNGSKPTNNSRWGSKKTLYDPCPVGWMVPAAKWSSVSNHFRIFDYPYNDTNKGMDFYGKFGNDRWGYWYPASGKRSGHDGELEFVGEIGFHWSHSPWVTTDKYNKSVEILTFSYTGKVNTWDECYSRAAGMSVRCIKM